MKFSDGLFKFFQYLFGRFYATHEICEKLYVREKLVFYSNILE